jgi:hypothetical protein
MLLKRMMNVKDFLLIDVLSIRVLIIPNRNPKNTEVRLNSR